MMKKIWLILLAIIFAFNTAQAKENEIYLPKPNLGLKTPLMETLQLRKSVKSFGKRGINDQNLSDLLWVSVGENREDGKRTIPTSMNSQDLDIYVLRADGAWLYNPKLHRLSPITDKDLRFLTAKQDYVLGAAIILIYVSGQDDMTAGMHAGSAYQNAGLYAAATGMNAVVRGFFDKDDIAKELKLPAGKKVVISQAFGWPRDK